MKNAAFAALGAAAAGPVVGARSAQASGLLPAYTDATNTFTADQRVTAKVGVGTVPAAPLHVARPDTGPALRVDAHTMALYASHERDWGGQTFDLVNLDHSSSGDAIFIVHGGGKPPGYTGATGGNAGLNVLIPYKRDGNVVNDRTGMRGLLIQTQAVTDSVKSIHVRHFSHDVAAHLEVQPPGYGQPVGRGGGLQIDDWSAENTARLRKLTAPGANRGLLSLEARWPNSDGTGAANALQVLDATGYTRALLTSAGKLALLDDAHVTRVQITSDGSAAFGANQRFGSQVRLVSEFAGKGMARNLALVNPRGVAGDGAQIEFDDAGGQHALIGTTFDSVAQGSRSASLKFSVRAADSLTERLTLGGAGIGFFGAAAVGRPTVTGSRSGGAALSSLLTALSRLGLIDDSTS